MNRGNDIGKYKGATVMRNKFKILSANYAYNVANEKILQKTVIIIHLYYAEYFDEEKKYIANIPDSIQIYIITANRNFCLFLKKYYSDKSNIHILSKANRGRDYAALLITANSIIKQYEYICFIHDKKEKSYSNKRFADNWRRLFFESTICNRNYIYNILNAFESDKKIGVLSAPLPPEQISLDYRGAEWFGNIDDYDSLMKKIGITVKNKYDYDPVTLGSVFWFRKSSLKQLIEYKFNYSDFPKEIMGYDYTISHTLERMIDAISFYNGYHNYYVMNDEYANKYLEINDNFLTKALCCLRKCNVIQYDKNNGVNLERTLKYANNTLNDDLNCFCSRFKKIIVVVDDYRYYDEKLIAIKRKGIVANKIYNVDEIKEKNIDDKTGVIVIAKNYKKVLTIIKNNNCYIIDN